MYGSIPYGSLPYAGSLSTRPETSINASVLSIGGSVIDPVIFTEEIVTGLSIGISVIQPTIIALNKSIIIKVNTVDISSQVIFTSLSVTNNLYSEPNNAYFEIIKSTSKSYVPTPNDEVEIIDTGVTIFKGLLIKILRSMNGFIESYNLEFKDWTEELSSTLVAQTYTGYTVEAIIADIFTALPAYDLTNISDVEVIGQIVSDNRSITDTLDKLAEMTNKYWYVSPNKEIFFFEKSDIQAPYDLTDTNGNYDYSSLKYDEDLTQIRNRITIKGKGVAAVTVEDLPSQTANGLREFYQRDDEILATSEATQKADALLVSYKDPIKVITFRTLSQGLFAGQQITIQSDLRGINETLNIESMSFRSVYNNRFYYEVKATSQRLGRIDDLFKKTSEGIDVTPAINDQGSLQTVAFSAIDDATIQWSAGSIIMSDGTTYSISASASQVLTADHVIYFDNNVSETELQISTTFSDGIGNGKIPLAYATKSAVATKGASIFPIGFGGKMQIDGGVHITDRSIIADNIAANAITANEISANAVTATKISVTDLSAISANMGTITAGTVTGAILQTASSGYRTRLTSSNGIEFLLDSIQKGIIYADAGDTLIIKSSNNTQFFSGAASAGVLNADGLTLPSSKKLAFSGGGAIFDFGAFLKVGGSGGGVCDLQVEGNVYPNSDNARQCGTASKRWQDINSEDAHIDDIFIGDGIFSSDGSQGITESKKYIVDIRSQTTQGRLEKKDSEIVVKDGLITNFGGDSSWTDAGPMNPT